MSPKDKAAPEEKPQTPEDVDEVDQDDAASPENQEQNGDRDESDGKPMTMEERKAKMLQLRAKMVRHSS
jgi:hypothetical protein